MTAAILTIGDELMIGQIVDTNSAWIAAWLDARGWRITTRISCGDDPADIRTALRWCMDRADLVITTGGIGPTADDRTVEALCGFADCEAVWHEDTWQRVLALLRGFNREPTELHRKQCYVPAVAEVIPNDRGSAPGLRLRLEGRTVISTPGVPEEMKHLLADKIGPELPEAGHTEHRFIRTAGEGETVIAGMIADIEASMPAAISLAYLPSFGLVTLRLSVYEAGHTGVLDQLHRAIAARLGRLVYADRLDSLSLAVGERLRAAGQTLGLGESCTGGYLSHLITSEAGSSDYFQGSVVPYAYELKTRLLGVTPEVLNRHGAVSEEVVLAMAEGTRRELGVTWALAISGIAGPGGATPDKPVGTVWIACAGPDGVRTRLLHLRRDRRGNIESAAVAALTMLWRRLQGQ